MKWFSNLKVSAKLLTGFISVSLITMTIGLFSYFKTSEITELGDILADQQAPSILSLGNINSSLNAIAVCERGLLNDEFTKRGTREAQYQVLDERLENIAKEKETIESLTMDEEERKSWEEFLIKYEKWREYGDNFLSLSHQKDKLIAQGADFDDDEVTALNQQMFDAYFEGRTYFVDASNIIIAIIDQNWAQIVASNQEVNEIEDNTILWIFVLSIAGFAAAIIIGLYISKLITTPIKEFMRVTSAMRNGNLHQRIQIASNDEFGEMSRSLNGFIDILQGFVQSVYTVAKGDFSIKVQKQHHDDEIAPALVEIVEILNKLQNEIDIMIVKYQDGFTDYKGEAAKFEGGYKKIVEGFNKSISNIIDVVREGTSTLEKIASGDLTARMTGEYKNNYKHYQEQINTVGESLNEVVRQVIDSVNATVSASNQISSSSEEMAAGAQEQSAQAAEVASGVAQMTTTIIETSRNTELAAKAATDAGKIAKEGGQVVQQTVQGMVRISEVVQRSAETVQELGKNSNEIGEIIQVIDDIADQTNLLALNAAIEAARAGEQGRGFAVVADEVRKLAERTSTATKEIAVMIKKIQEDTTGAVKSIQEGTEEAEKGKILADKAGTALVEIINGAQEVVDIITQVATASEEQSSASEQISKNIEAISNVTHESASGIQQMANAAEDLNRLMSNLSDMVSGFKTTASNNGSKYKTTLKNENHISTFVN